MGSGTFVLACYKEIHIRKSLIIYKFLWHEHDPTFMLISHIFFVCSPNVLLFFFKLNLVCLCPYSFIPMHLDTLYVYMMGGMPPAYHNLNLCWLLTIFFFLHLFDKVTPATTTIWCVYFILFYCCSFIFIHFRATEFHFFSFFVRSIVLKKKHRKQNIAGKITQKRNRKSLSVIKRNTILTFYLKVLLWTIFVCFLFYWFFLFACILSSLRTFSPYFVFFFLFIYFYYALAASKWNLFL